MPNTASSQTVNDLPEYIKPYWSALLNAATGMVFSPEYIRSQQGLGGGNTWANTGTSDPVATGGTAPSVETIPGSSPSAAVNGVTYPGSTARLELTRLPDGTYGLVYRPLTTDEISQGQRLAGGGPVTIGGFDVSRVPGGADGTGTYGTYSLIINPQTGQYQLAPPSPPAVGPAAGPTGGSPRATGGTSPWIQSVTGGTVNADGSPGPTYNFATPDNPNINYLTLEAANDLARRYGTRVGVQDMSQDYGPAGAPSQPIYSLDARDMQRGNLASDDVNIPAGQVQFWRDRGDSEAVIQQRLGLRPGNEQFVRYGGR